MATITLYSGKINQMSSLINKAKTSVKSYKSDLKSLKSKVLSIDESICDVDDVISSIKSSTKTQEDKIETLENLKQDINDFISDVVRIDGDAAEAINKSKDDFYNKYEYLTPECEKSGWEKFKDGCKKVGEWCKEHWKEILAIAVVITGVVLCFVPGLNWLGSGILIGSLKGALSGGLIGGLSSWASGGSFWEGFKDGVVTGAIFGGVFGGLGAAGEFLGNAKAVSLLANGKWLGKSCSFAKTVGTVAKASGAITFVMGGFDTLALGSKILFGDNWFSDFNAALHESSIYNIAQTTIASVAVFTGGMNSGFNKAANSAGVKPSCFVAGTLVMAVAGMVAIETIKSGDKVISTDPETMETSPKTVLETYIREVTTLVHLTVNGEEIVTTVDHPFYVKNQGFIKAGELIVGDELLDVNGNVLLVEKFNVELTDEPVTVYNFQVEGFHTYHVGCFYVLVHNADYNQSPKEIMAEHTKGLDTREHPSKYKQISAKEKSRLESKVRDRTITKDEYKKLEWNKKISARRQDAVNEFWDQEQIRLQKGENGTRNWSPQQKADILNGKRPTYNGKTIQGHHTYSVSKYPHLSGNSEVIYPATFNEHLKGWHGGNFRNSLPGEPIKTIIDF
ncbi:polymorphic toxin-type HINT domain-containing protein [Ruminococcus bicirculans (ex Wegman et al. 2014)]|uniref:polymorphic toxin-type HINT domain-containing protein n=1 Tax=Ruminococcus bicirculans (ex Wegman et al. 2014) TaxID=1160721 RepID=UPI003992EFA1